MSSLGRIANPNCGSLTLGQVANVEQRMTKSVLLSGLRRPKLSDKAHHAPVVLIWLKIQLPAGSRGSKTKIPVNFAGHAQNAGS
jgi:hypothetical protein